MSSESIMTIIEMLPTIFINFIPGYLFVRVINFRFSKVTNDDNHLLLKSIVISFIIITTLDQLFSFVNLNFDIEETIIKIIILVFSVVVGLIWCKILNCRYTRILLLKLGFNKSLNTNIFDDIVDIDKGLKILAFLPEEELIYAGEIRRYEDGEKIDDYFIVLSNYVVIGYDGEEIDNREEDNTKWVMLNTKNISRIELIYHEESEKIKTKIRAMNLTIQENTCTEDVNN